MTGKWFGFEWKEVLDEALDLFERRDFEEATKAFEACRAEAGASKEIDRYLGECYLNLAVQALAQRDFTISAANAENALRINPGYPDLHTLAAKAYLGLGHTLLARRHLRKALILNPGYMEARQLVDQLLEATPQDAATSGDAVRDHVRYLLMLGDECAKQGLWPETLALFEKAEKLAPGYPDIGYRIATVHLAMGNHEEAERSLIRCLEMKGSYAQALQKLGEIRASRGDTEEASRLESGAQSAFVA